MDKGLDNKIHNYTFYKKIWYYASLIQHFTSRFLLFDEGNDRLI